MAYTKQNFISGQVLKASHMNNIETAIVDNENAITALNSNMSSKADSDHTHDEYLTSIPSEYKTRTENDSLYQPIGDYVSSDDVPTKTSQLTNDSGFITELPTIPTKTSQLTNDSGFATIDQLTNGTIPELTSPVFIWNLDYGVYRLPENCLVHYRGTNAAISTTATSSSFLFVYGNLNDGTNSTDTKHFIMFRGARINNASGYSMGDRYLTAGWTSEDGGNYIDIKLSSNFVTTDDVPTKTSQLTNDSGFITELPTIPTKTSQLTNDSGFITAIPSEYITETELSELIKDININTSTNKLPSGLGTINLSELETGVYVVDDFKQIYCSSAPTNTEVFDEESNFGSGTNDLTDYIFEGDLLVHYRGVNENNAITIYSCVISSWDIKRIVYDGGIENKELMINVMSWDDLATKSKIPTKTSQLTNDSSYATEEYVTNKITEMGTGGNGSSQSILDGNVAIESLVSGVYYAGDNLTFTLGGQPAQSEDFSTLKGTLISVIVNDNYMSIIMLDYLNIVKLEFDKNTWIPNIKKVIWE